VRDWEGTIPTGATGRKGRIPLSCVRKGPGAESFSPSEAFDLYDTTRGDGYLQHVTDDGSWQIATINGAATRMLIDPADSSITLPPRSSVSNTFLPVELLCVIRPDRLLNLGMPAAYGESLEA